VFKPQTTTNGDTLKLQLLETNPAGLRLRSAQPRPSGPAIWVLARTNSSSSCPKQPTSEENCFKDQPKRLLPEVKHRLPQLPLWGAFDITDLLGGSTLLSIGGSVLMSAEGNAVLREAAKAA
jgi:hypothetical protein